MFNLKRVLFCILLLIFSAFTFAEELIIKVELDSVSTASLDSNAKSYTSTAYNRFLQDMLIVNQISVRNSSVDSTLRAIQKQSQIDAGSGMGSDSAAYASDKGSQAKLSMLLKMLSVKNGLYQFSCEVSEIEKMNLISKKATSSLQINNFSDEVIDSLAYEVLLSLQQRGYIQPLEVNVVNQLLHSGTSSENYTKYVQDYAKQIAQAEKELNSIKKSSQSLDDKIESENKSQALKLKIEMLEKRKQQAEENLRRQKEDEANEAKKKQELEQLASSRQAELMNKMGELEKKKQEILKEATNKLSLKKRIELIENDLSNYNQLKKQLDQITNESNSYFDQKCEEEIKQIRAQGWTKADTDANGNPTQTALHFRQQKIDAVKSKYESAKKKAQTNFNESVKSDLDSYKAQIKSNVSEMEKTTYVFRSIDKNDDFLSLIVDEFDGEKNSWAVNSRLNMSSIPKTDTSAVVLPKALITYKEMTGKLPATKASTLEEYTEYQKLVEAADLYFRTSVPYLYSEIALKVKYIETFDKYYVSPVYFRIHKTEDRSMLFEYRLSDFSKTDNKNTNASQTKNNSNSSTGNSDVKQKLAAEKKLYAKSHGGRQGLFCGLAGFDGVGENAGLLNGCMLNIQVDIQSPYACCGCNNNSWMGLEANYSLMANDIFYMDYAILGGFSARFNSFMPYAGLGLGVGALKDVETDESLHSFLTLKFIGGIDYISSDSYTIGLEFRYNILQELDPYVSLGVNVGLRWD